jgi:hypothetical protein
MDQTMETVQQAADTVSLAQWVLQAVEEEYLGYAPGLADRLAELASELGERLRWEDAARRAGMDHIGSLVEAQLDRLRGLDGGA